MSKIDRAAEIIGLATRGAHITDGHPMKMSDHTAQIIAEALADDGLITPEPQIIRTLEELTALDPDALLYGRYEGYDSHLNVADLQYLNGTWRPEVERALPAVVIATGDHVRAARQALEAAKGANK